MTYADWGNGTTAKRFWKLSIQEALDAWTWNDLITQEWNFGVP